MHATFLEKDFVRDLKPRSKVMLEEMSKDMVSLMVPKMPNNSFRIEEVTTEQQEPRELHRSGRIVRQHDRYLYHGKSVRKCLK